MAYTKAHDPWVDGLDGTRIDAVDLNNIEAGIAAAHTALDGLLVQVGTLTLPSSPAAGQNVTVLADSTTILPEDVTWDSGGEPTVTDRLLISLVWSGTDWVGTYGLSIPAYVAPDLTGPNPGILTPSAITSSGFTLAVLGASDAGSGLSDAGPYRYSIDNGSTYSDWTSAGMTFHSLSPDTGYQCTHQARDNAGNVTAGEPITVTTAPDPVGAAIEFVASASTGADGTTHTYPGVTFGEPSEGRQIIVALSYTHGGATAPAITIGGVPATIDFASMNGTVGRAILARAAVPSGASGDVVITYPAICNRSGIGVYRTPVAVSASPGVTSGAGDSMALAQSVVTNQAGGTVIAAGITVDVPIAWSGAVKDYEAEPDATVRVTSASTTAAGNLTIKPAGTGNGYDSVAAVAYVG